MENPMPGYSILDWMCIATALLVPLPALWGTIKAWWTGELGAGGRRPEPTITALLANASWLLFGYTEGQLEPLGLNAWGGAIQAVGLVVFLWLCTDGVWEETMFVSLAFSIIYYCTTITVGTSGLQLEIYKMLCTVAGMAAAAAPLLTYKYLLANPTADLLPHWALLAGYTMHGLVWSARALLMEHQNYYMLAQNGLGAFCSFCQLVTVIRALRMAEDPHQGVQAGPLGGAVPVLDPMDVPLLEPVPVPPPRRRRSPRIAAIQAAAAAANH